MEKNIEKEILNILAKQKRKEKLSKEEIEKTVMGYTKNVIDEKYMEEYIRHIYNFGMSEEELFYLTEVMAFSGEVFKGLDDLYIDKHSTGGVGDKVTLILMPLLATLGFKCAKMSGRSLGLTGGTADKLESIKDINIDLSKVKFLENAEEIGICLMTQTEKIAPADKKIYDLRDRKKLTDSIPLIASSIMSKKIALGCKNLILDVTCGSGAFMKNEKDAEELGKLMQKIGENFGMRVLIVISNMDKPLGKTVGNRLEVLEALEVLSGRKSEVRDLCVDFAYLFVEKYREFFKKKYEETKKEEYLKISKLKKADIEEVLDNNKAKDRFFKMLKKQGVKEDEIKKLEEEYLEYNIKDAEEINIYSEKSGYIEKISAIGAAKCAFESGSGKLNIEDKIDPLAGIRYLKFENEKIKKDEIIGKIYLSKERYLKLSENKVKKDTYLNKLKKMFLESVKILDIESENKDEENDENKEKLEEKTIEKNEILKWF